MFKVTKNSPNRIDIDFSGKLNSDDMRVAIDDLLNNSKDIENGRMLYRLNEFDIPTLGALGVELSRIFELLRLVSMDSFTVSFAVLLQEYAMRIEIRSKYFSFFMGLMFVPKFNKTIY